MQIETQDAICESLETLSQAGDYYKWLANRVKPYMKGKVLEIGAGIGNFARWAQENADEYHVSDVDQRLVAKLSQEFHRALNWDLYTPFPNDELYDSVVILNVVEHLEDDLQALRCLNARLKPGGNLILMVPAMQFLYGSLDRSFGHYRRYTKASISRVIRATSFEILKTEYINVIGMAGWFLYGKILKRQNLPQQLCSRFNIVVPLLKLERLLAYFAGLSVIVIARKS
ncbi:class I SAM-dependent methyltransferase [bacterium]|nr:class I SAM-dependent methyltransferase [bacterium]